MEPPRKPPGNGSFYLRGELDRLADLAAREYDKALVKADNLRSKLASAPDGPKADVIRYKLQDADDAFNRWARRSRALAEWTVVDDEGDGWGEEISRVRKHAPERLVEAD